MKAVARTRSRSGKVVGAKKTTRPARPRRAEVKEQTRAALVQAALELFAEEGLDLPSLDSICDRAGYTRGAFYVHFATREDLLVAVMDHLGSSFFASVFAELAKGDAPSGTRRFHDAARRFVAAVDSGAYPLMGAGAVTRKRSSRALVRPHQLLEACARSPVVRGRYRDLVQLSLDALTGLVHDDQQHGHLRDDVDPTTVASMALALVIGAQTLGDVGLRLELGTLADALEKLLRARA